LRYLVVALDDPCGELGPCLDQLVAGLFDIRVEQGQLLPRDHPVAAIDGDLVQDSRNATGQIDLDVRLDETLEALGLHGAREQQPEADDQRQSIA